MFSTSMFQFGGLMHRTFIVTIAYLSRDWSGELQLNDEHTEWNWFAAQEIPENVSPPITPLIEQFKCWFSKIEKDAP